MTDTAKLLEEHGAAWMADYWTAVSEREREARQRARRGGGLAALVEGMIDAEGERPRRETALTAFMLDRGFPLSESEPAPADGDLRERLRACASDPACGVSDAARLAEGDRPDWLRAAVREVRAAELERRRSRLGTLAESLGLDADARPTGRAPGALESFMASHGYPVD